MGCDMQDEEMLHIFSHRGDANQRTMRCHLTPSRMARLKSRIITSDEEDIERSEPSHIAGRNVKQCGHVENQSGSSSNG